MGIETRELRYPSATGTTDIYAKVWVPEGEPQAVLQIAHGMAEHIARYDDFACFMAENGVLVAANDHAGHGGSVGPEKTLGYFGESGGWGNVVADIHRLREMIAPMAPGAPYILMGHSMGSFLARTYAARQGDGAAGFIFSGTAGKNPAVGAGRLMAKLERRRNGPRKPSRMLHNMSFGSYNKAFAPNRTESDWLSRDEAQVDRYVADPLCGFIFTAEAFLDLFDGLEEINGKHWAEKLPDAPIYLFSGEEDPVGGNGKGVREVYDWLQESGKPAEIKLYPGGRHEMLNEMNKEEVYDDILRFIQTTSSNKAD